MMHLKSTVSLLLIYLFLVGPLSQPFARTLPAPHTVTADSNARGGGPMEDTGREPKGLRFRLSEGTEQTDRTAGARLAAATRLSESEPENVLKRLPPIKAEPTDEQVFALRERSLPAPRT